MEDFRSTTGTPIVVDQDTGICYVYTNDAISPISPANAAGFGAGPGVDAGPLLTQAFLNSYGVYVTTPITVDTAPTYTQNLIEILPEGSMSGAAAAGLGYAGFCAFETLQLGTLATDFATKYMRRQVNHAGGDAGYTSACLRVETYVSAGATNYEWNAVFKLDSNATAGQNNSAYFQTLAHSTSGPLWCDTHEFIEVDAVNDPVVGRVTQEIDHRSNGTDANNARVVQDIVVTRYDPSGAATEVGIAHRVQTGGDAQATVNVAYDTTQANIGYATLQQAEGQGIAWGDGRLFMVTGAPDNAMGDDGDFCFRRSGGGGARIYIKAAGAWGAFA